MIKLIKTEYIIYRHIYMCVSVLFFIRILPTATQRASDVIGI